MEVALVSWLRGWSGSGEDVWDGVVVVLEVVAARGGEWCGGSSRSEWGECLRAWPGIWSEMMAGGGGGRRLAGGGGMAPENVECVVVVLEVVAARGGEWCGGSSRSEWGECLRAWPGIWSEMMAGGGGGRRLAGGGGSGAGKCGIHTQPSITQNTYPHLTIPQQPQAEFPQIDSNLAVPTFLPSDDLIAFMNKAMAFLSTVFTPRYPSTNNQLRSSSNLRNQATVKMVESLFSKFKEDKVRMLSVKVLLVQAYAEGKELDEDQLAFLTYPGVANGQVAQTITHNAASQADDLDAYDSNCDDISSAKAVLMANLSSYDSDVLFKDKANNESKIVNESLTAELERYKE
nr:hypothetical protein [Tanacetum cinerariifolium]